MKESPDGVMGVWEIDGKVERNGDPADGGRTSFDLINSQVPF
jgi:hypothetical protein